MFSKTYWFNSIWISHHGSSSSDAIVQYGTRSHYQPTSRPLLISNVRENLVISCNLLIWLMPWKQSQLLIMLTTNSLGIIIIHFNRLTITINQIQRPEVLQIWKFSVLMHQCIWYMRKQKRIWLSFFNFVKIAFF